MLYEEIIKICELRSQGYTYEAIGKIVGYTKQHVQHTLTALLSTNEHKKPTYILYPNLRNEIKSHYKSMTAFSKSTGFKYKRICDILYGTAKVFLDEAIFLSEHFNQDMSYLFAKKKHDDDTGVNNEYTNI